jgi:hypothetical protein
VNETYGCHFWSESVIFGCHFVTEIWHHFQIFGSHF